MKHKNFFSGLMAILSLMFTLLVCSCTESYVEESTTPIELQVYLDLKGLDLPAEAFTAASPVKVMGLRQECGAYSKLFVDEAYIDEEGHVFFLGKPHYWLSDRLMMFTIYWPADATVTTDNYGRITYGDCAVTGHSLPVNPLIQEYNRTPMDYKIYIRAFDNPE